MENELILTSFLILSGLVLLAIEIFLIPGFGFIGLFGIGTLGSGCYLCWIKFGMVPGIIVSLGSIAVSILFIYIFPKSKTAKVLILHGSLNNKNAKSDPSELKVSLIGKTGKALTILRPSGNAEIEGNKLSVMAEGVFVEAGEPIEVIEDDGYKIIVKKSGN